jgi:hypothetical protein
MPYLVRPLNECGVPQLGHRLLDDYLGMVASRARPNTVLAAAFDLKVFFSVVGKSPEDVDAADVLSFVVAQRQPRRGSGADRGRRVGPLGAHDQAVPGLSYRPVRVPDGSRCRHEKPGTPRIVDPHSEPRGGWGAADPRFTPEPATGNDATMGKIGDA